MPSVEVAGSELHYVREGSGEPMLLIQGMSATHLAWGEPFLASLRESFDCIVFDNRGMGLSGRAEMPFTIADLAGDTVGLLDALEVESAHVVGISMGGMIAQELVLAHPDRIRTLTLGATYCGGPDGKLMDPEDVKRLGAAVAASDPDQVRRVMWEINLSPSFREDDSRFAAFEEMAQALRAPGPVVLQQMRACGAHKTSDRLGQISNPTLVIHGTEDHLLPVANGHEIAALIPTRLELLDGVGHMFWWEQPDRAAELIRDHAGQAAGSSLPLTSKT
jgi:3-oxoadipate enol-lactonase